MGRYFYSGSSVTFGSWIGVSFSRDSKMSVKRRGSLVLCWMTGFDGSTGSLVDGREGEDLVYAAVVVSDHIFLDELFSSEADFHGAELEVAFDSGIAIETQSLSVRNDALGRNTGAFPCR